MDYEGTLDHVYGCTEAACGYPVWELRRHDPKRRGPNSLHFWRRMAAQVAADLGVPAEAIAAWTAAPLPRVKAWVRDDYYRTRRGWLAARERVDRLLVLDPDAAEV